MNNDQKFSRRDLLRLMKILSIQAVALGLIGYGYSTELEMNLIEITKVTLKLPRLDPAFKGLRFVQISDFHLGQWINKERLERVFKIASEQAPDYFILTGDYLEFRPYGARNGWATYEENLNLISSSFSQLSAYRPTIAILGNHDHKIYAEWIEQALSAAGVTVLRNSVTTIRRGRSEIHIAGLDDVNQKMARLDQLMNALPETGCSILLAHEPDFADASAATERFDLQISGHSHGGQIVIPLIGAPLLPESGQKYPSGLYNVDKMLLYTNRGIGVTTINVRFNCRPEITVFTLEAA